MSQEIVLSPSQQFIVDAFPNFLLSDAPCMVISGAAGTGKTFLVQQLTELAPAQEKIVRMLDPTIKRRRFYYTATTNKAAEVLRGTLNKPTSTIHKLLGLRVRNDYKTGKQVLIPSRTTGASLTNSVVFIDEASMINDELYTKIRSCQRKYRDCKVVFIGDKYQLPPVKEDICAVFRLAHDDFFYELKEIQRQAKDSPIISLATNYRTLLDTPSETWPEIRQDDKSIFRYQNSSKFAKAIRERYKKPHGLDEVKIIAWSNSRVHQYNEWIQRKVLGFEEAFPEGMSVTTNKPLVVNQKIVASTDFSELEILESNWAPVSIEGVEVDGWAIQLLNTTNGNTHTVFQPADWKHVRALQKGFQKDKNWPLYFRIKEQWADLRPIHASTVHKAQGSTYREVFIDLEDIGKNTRWRDLVRLLYVAITRASHIVHLYGNLSVNHKVRSAEDTMEAFANVQNLINN